MERERPAIPAASHETNRVALLTPTGVGAIAVVRIAGAAVSEFLSNCFSGRITPMRCTHGTLRDDQRVIDDPVVVLHANRDIADINLHGGEWVVRSCIELAQKHGFEPVDSIPDSTPDEFEAEMIAALPLARTREAIELLLDQPRRWQEFLSKAGANSKSDIQRILSNHTLDWMLNPPKVAIVGQANVGKSTLANQLFGQERSITADVPGTTRDWVGDWTTIHGLPILLIDTPGLRHCADAIEQSAIATSRAQIEQADLVLVILDPTRPFEPQNDILRQYPGALAVLNKSDLPETWDTRSINPIHTVAVTGNGIDALRSEIRKRFISEESSDLPVCWTARQRSQLEARDRA